jgi:hypothetical protein
MRQGLMARRRRAPFPEPVAGEGGVGSIEGLGEGERAEGEVENGAHWRSVE